MDVEENLMSSNKEKYSNSKKFWEQLKAVVSFTYVGFSCVFLLLLFVGHLVQEFNSSPSIFSQQYLQFLVSYSVKFTPNSCFIRPIPYHPQCIQDLLVYKWSSFEVSVTALLNLILSLLYLKTLKYEKNSENMNVLEYHFDQTNRKQTLRFIQTLKDARFKRSVLIGFEFLILCGIVSFKSDAATTLVPYSLLSIINILMLCISGRLRIISKFSQYCTCFLIAFITTDLCSLYLCQALNVNQGPLYSSIGFVLERNQLAQFTLKTVLLITQFMKINHSHTMHENCSKLFKQIRKRYSGDEKIQRALNSSMSFTKKVMRPIVANFLFSTLGLLYSFKNPNIAMLLFMPFLIGGFFIREQRTWYSIVTKIFLTLIVTMRISFDAIYIIINLYINVMGSKLDQDQYAILQKICSVFNQNIDEIIQSKYESLQVTYDYIYFIIFGFVGSQICKNQHIKKQYGCVIKKSRIINYTFYQQQSHQYNYLSVIDIICKDQEPNNPTLEHDQLTVVEDNVSDITKLSLIKQNNYLDVKSLLKSQQNSQFSSPRAYQSEQEQQKTNSAGRLSVTVDETTRGKLRKFLYHQYVKVNGFASMIGELAIIHSSKVSLFVLFVVSATTGATVINALLFSLFLVLTTISYQNVQKFWKITIVTTAIVLTVQYGLQIFKPELSDLQKQVIDAIGLQLQNTDSTMFEANISIYSSLLVVLVLTYHIIHSKKYEEYLTKFQNLEHENNQSSHTIQTDALTSFIIRYSIHLTIFALFIECILLPINALNLILIIIMANIMIKYLNAETHHDLYMNLEKTLVILKWLSTLFIFLKYMFQFTKYFNPTTIEVFQNYSLIQGSSQTTQNLLKMYEKLPLLQRLLGMENSFVPVKLFSLALVMSLSSLQTKFLKNGYLMQFIEKEDNPQGISEDLVAENKSKSMRITQKLGTLLVYIGDIIMPIAFPFLVILQSLKHSSPMSLSFVISVLYSLYSKNGSKTSLFIVGYVLIISMVILYSAQFTIDCILVQDSATVTQIVRWVLGIINDNEYGFFDKPLASLFWLSMVCILMKDINNMRDKLRSGNITQEMLDQALEEGDMEKVQNMQIQWENQYINRKMEKVQRVISKALYDGSSILQLIAVLLAMVYKKNILSLVMFGVMLFSSKRISVFFAVIITYQFIMIIDHKQQVIIKEISMWKSSISSFLCSEQACIDDWQKWLSIGYIKQQSILLDYSVFQVLMILNLLKTRFGIEGKSDLEKIEKIEQILSEDTLKSRIANILFIELPYISLMVLFIYAFTFQKEGSGAVLISGGYLFLGLYYFIYLSKFFSKDAANYQRYLIIFNRIVLLVILIFQCPIFGCPALLQNNQGYITTQECSTYQDSLKLFDIFTTKNQLDLFKKTLKDDNNQAQYILLVNSLGLRKLDQSSIMIGLLIMIILAELQIQILSHPFFTLKVRPEYQRERKVDGLLRAIIYIEKVHLNKLWSYKAIKEEIRILHSRLLRITQSIKNSSQSRHLLNDDYEEEDDGIHQRSSMISDASSTTDYQEERQSLIERDYLEQIDLNQKPKFERLIQEILDQHSNDIENYALDLMSNQESPIIPLKLFQSSFSNFVMNNILKKYESLANDQKEGVDIKSLVKIDQRMLEEYLLQIALKLQKQVMIKNRIDLFNQSGIGLDFITKQGHEQLLKEGDYFFYRQVIFQEARNSINDVEESYNPQILQIKTERPVQNNSFWRANNYRIREYLWNKLIDSTLFMSLKESHDQQTLYQIDLTYLLFQAILSQSVNIAYLAIFMAFILNADVLSLFLPLSVLLYANLSQPMPEHRYWKVLTLYQFAIMSLKFMYQMPIFCPTPAYQLFSFDECSYQVVPAEALLKRIDYILGIHKYSGPSSYPRDQGLFIGILPDMLVLFSILLVKIYLTKTGKWHLVRLKSSVYDTPSLKKSIQTLSQDQIEDKHQRNQEKLRQYDESDFKGKVLIHAKRYYKKFRSFILKLLPIYMKPIQKNRDIRSNQEEPTKLHNVKRVKPGKDFFNQSFFSLLMIFAFNLFFYRSWTGESHSSALSSANLQRFSVSQVAILFFVLVLMMIERMLYRVRQNDSSHSNKIAKHQLTFKLFIHVVLVLIVHIDLGLLIPKHNNITFDKKAPLVLMYLLWVYYFIQSAQQIKHGYPQAPFKAPFIRDTSLITQWAFRIYKAMPFLWEMKVIIDWTVTSTCLDLFQWFKLDDAFNYLYQCQVQNSDRAQRRDPYSQRSWCEKFFQGFCFAFALILVILAPILLFSGINPIMVNNPVHSGSLQISLMLNENGNTYDILQTQAFHIQSLNETDFNSLTEIYSEGSIKFEPQKMQKMYFSPYSEFGWQISPPSLEKFIQDYQDLINTKSNAFFDVKAQWTFKRDNPIGNEHATQESKVRLDLINLQPIIDRLSYSNGTYQNNTSNQESTLLVESLLPKFLKLGDTQQAHVLDVMPLQTNTSVYSSIRLNLNHESDSRNMDNQLYWTYEVLESDRDSIFKSNNPNNEATKDLVLVIYNEQVIGSLFGTALQLSVVGLYATIVIAIGRFLRLAFDRISQRVIYEEMDPETTEQLFEICEGIYIAQLEGDLVKEKRLYDLLIRMYRSPETLMRINRQNHLMQQSQRIGGESINENAGANNSRTILRMKSE